MTSFGAPDMHVRNDTKLVCGESPCGSGKRGGSNMMYFQRLYLDREKDIAVELYMEGERLLYVMRTPNHHTGNLRLFVHECG